MKNVIVTGCAGFIGSHAIKVMQTKGWNIIGIDSFKHRGQYTRLDINKTNIDIYHHDIASQIDPQLENKILARKINSRGNIVDGRKIDYIFNFASESAVERSAQDPVPPLVNNSMLAINMLEFARRIKPKLFFQISTDEVFGEAPGNTAHKEWSSIIPSSPYSASKASQEAVAIAYWRTYNTPVVITNTMNIIGEMQDKEKFLPKIINSIMTDQEIPIYVDRDDKIGSRVYTDVLNKIDALIFLAEKLDGIDTSFQNGYDRPPRYNICGSHEFNNLEFVELVSKIMEKPFRHKLIKPDVIRPGYDSRYALDNCKLLNFGWSQPYTIEETIRRVVDFTLRNQEWLI